MGRACYRQASFTEALQKILCYAMRTQAERYRQTDRQTDTVELGFSERFTF